MSNYNNSYDPLEILRSIKTLISNKIPHWAWMDDDYFNDKSIDNVVEDLYETFVHGNENNHGTIDRSIDLYEYVSAWLENKHSKANSIMKSFYNHFDKLDFDGDDKFHQQKWQHSYLKESNKEEKRIGTIQLQPGQIVKDINNVEYEIEEGDVLQENISKVYKNVVTL